MTKHLLRFKGRKAYIVQEAQRLSGEDEVSRALDAAIDIIWNRPDESRANSDMADMARLLWLLKGPDADYRPPHESTRRIFEMMAAGVDPFEDKTEH